MTPLDRMHRLARVIGSIAPSLREEAVRRSMHWLVERQAGGTETIAAFGAPGAGADALSFKERMGETLQRLRALRLPEDELRERAWEQCAKAVRAYVTEGKGQLDPEPELLLYAALSPAGALVPPFDLEEASALEWSRLVVHALVGDAVPRSILGPALIALGLGPSLPRVREWLSAHGAGMAEENDFEALARTARKRSTSSAPPALIVAEEDSKLAGRWQPAPGFPCIVLDPSSLLDLMASVDLRTRAKRARSRRVEVALGLAECFEITAALVEVGPERDPPGADMHPLVFAFGLDPSTVPDEVVELASEARARFAYLTLPGVKPPGTRWPVVADARSLEDAIRRLHAGTAPS